MVKKNRAVKKRRAVKPKEKGLNLGSLWGKNEYLFSKEDRKKGHACMHGLELRGKKAGLPREPFLALSEQHKVKIKEIIENIKKIN